MADRIRIILDTDIGNDIDDAVALAYLLRQPRCDLVGITTVTGDVAQRCALSEYVCRAAGRTDIPIHAGAGPVLLHGPGQPTVHQYAAIRNKPHRAEWPAGTAVEFMRAEIRKRPGEIVLLTIGPLTNAALLFATDPEIPKMLKGMVAMAGVFFPYECDREWNCLVDPVATAITYPRAPRGMLSIGLDVTTKCQLDSVQVRERFKGAPLEAVMDLAEIWFGGKKEKPRMTFHDPLAAAVIFNPGLCGYADGTVTVDPGPGPREGLTAFKEGQGPHRVARTVDPDAFFAEYFGVFK